MIEKRDPDDRDPIEHAHLTAIRRERIRLRLVDAVDLLVAHWSGAQSPMMPEGQRSRTKPTSRPPMPAGPLSTRDAAWRDLRSWAQMVMEERDLTQGPRTLECPDLALFLARHADWIAAHDAGQDCADEVAQHARRIRDLDKGYYARRFQLGRCPEEVIDDTAGVSSPCAGNLWALMRQEDGLLPDRVLCDQDAEHVWEPHQWVSLGRRLGHFDQSGAQRLVTRLAGYSVG